MRDHVGPKVPQRENAAPKELGVNPSDGHNHPMPPQAMTDACFKYYGEWVELGHLFVFLLDTAAYADAADRQAHDARLRLAATPDERQREEQRMQHPQSSDELKRFLPQLLEMRYVREVDNFLGYLTELLTCIFTKDPRVLSSSQDSVTLEFIMQHQSMDDLVRAVVENTVDNLSFLGFRRLTERIEQRYALGVFSSDIQRTQIVRIIETRNIIVHNRSTVSRTFLERVPASPYQVGDDVRLELSTVLSDTDELARLVSEVDERAVRKFSLATPRLATDVPRLTRTVTHR